MLNLQTRDDDMKTVSKEDNDYVFPVTRITVREDRYLALSANNNSQNR